MDSAISGTLTVVTSAAAVLACVPLFASAACTVCSCLVKGPQALCCELSRASGIGLAVSAAHPMALHTLKPGSGGPKTSPVRWQSSCEQRERGRRSEHLRAGLRRALRRAGGGDTVGSTWLGEGRKPNGMTSKWGWARAAKGGEEGVVRELLKLQQGPVLTSRVQPESPIGRQAPSACTSPPSNSAHPTANEALRPHNTHTPSDTKTTGRAAVAMSSKKHVLYAAARAPPAARRN